MNSELQSNVSQNNEYSLHPNTVNNTAQSQSRDKSWSILAIGSFIATIVIWFVFLAYYYYYKAALEIIAISDSATGFSDIEAIPKDLTIVYYVLLPATIGLLLGINIRALMHCRSFEKNIWLRGDGIAYKGKWLCVLSICMTLGILTFCLIGIISSAI